MNKVTASIKARIDDLKFIAILMALPTNIMPPTNVQNFANGIYDGTIALSEAVLNKCPMPNKNNIMAKKHLPGNHSLLIKESNLVIAFLAFIEANTKNPPEIASVLLRLTQYFILSLRVVADKYAGRWPNKNNSKNAIPTISATSIVFLFAQMKIPLAINKNAIT